MFRFEHIEFFYALAVIPILAVLFVWYLVQRKRKLHVLGDTRLVTELSPYANLRKRYLKTILFIVAIGGIILAMCNLQTGSKLTEVKREGAELMVCLDVSNSMLAQDLNPNRLTRAKYALERMIDMLEGDQLGLIIFAGEAYVQLPMTSDYNAAKMFLSSIGPGMVPAQGTNLSAAISKAAESFSKEEGRNKAIILITDGENHEPEALEAAAHAASAGIMINTIGIGSENGVPIPLTQDGVVKGYRKDREGNTIITKLNPAILKEIAAKGKGVYVQASQADLGLEAILGKIAELDKAKIESKMYTDYEDQFQWFLGISILFLVAEFFLAERTSEWYKKLNLFGNATS
ncbi:MAG TPA: VWA domain-containing protein [Bacteroidia bacterium]|nr:VWA domain-containing protein [Bacteroidia bacterium]